MLITFDPSYRNVAFYIQERDLFYLIRNELNEDEEDTFLWKLKNILDGIRKDIDKPVFIAIEYTNVPYIKPMSKINRVIGVILASMSPLDGWCEINMNEVYRHFGIKARDEHKKKKLKDRIKEIKDCFPTHIFQIKRLKDGKNVVSYKYENTKNPEQDCIDAYAIFLYIRDKFKKEV